MPKSKAYKEIFKSVKKTYLGKDVPKKYQDRYGKKYDKDEMKSLAIAITKSRGFKV